MRGFAPHPTYGAAPLPPTKVDVKCLAAVVLAHHDRVLSLWRLIDVAFIISQEIF